MIIIKRDGRVVEYDKDKISDAVLGALTEVRTDYEYDFDLVPEADGIADLVDAKLQTLNKEEVSVEEIQDIVEVTLMAEDMYDIAKAYILYRENKAKERKKDIFKPRKNLKPYEYPELEAYKEAIQHSYWLFSEFNYTSDIQDYKVNAKPHEREAIRRAMLAIAQVEVDVKEFWGNLYKRMPKPELANVGATFAESEVRHADAYANLLELLGLNSDFEKINEIPALRNRVNYLKKHNQYALTGDNKDFVIAVLLFSSAIEHISLFSQFLIMMSFNKYKNLFNGVSNAIEATSKEEQLHGEFGIDLVNTVREEHPEWFNESMEQDVLAVFYEAWESEKALLDWILEEGELDFLPRVTIENFIKNRLNNSLKAVGFKPIFEVDEKEVEKTDWFDDEIVSSSHKDFFHKRSTNYTKRAKAITANDLF